MSERVSCLQADLSTVALDAERMSREAAHYKEQEQVMSLSSSSFTADMHIRFSEVTLYYYLFFTQIRVAAMNTELLAVRSQLEDAASVHETELHSLRETCTDQQSRADIALKEVADAIKVTE